MESNREYQRERQICAEASQSVGEHILPDYQGDVKKILYSHAEAEPGGRYQSGDTLECVGVVVYKIVYLDSEGRITPVSFTTDYDVTVKCPAEQYMDSIDCTRVANFSLRLMGPRRFSVKAQLECELYVSERAEYILEGDGVGCELEYSGTTKEIATAKYLSMEEREMAEEIALIEGAILDEVEVIVHSAEPRGLSVTRNGSKADLRCQLYVKALVKCESEQPRTYECAMDVSETFDLGEMDEGAVIVPRVEILSETVGLNPAENGVSLVASVILEVGARAIFNNPLELVSDCYSTERGVELTHGELSYTELLASRNVNEKLSCGISRTELGAENVRNVLYESAKVKIEEISSVDNTVTLSGSIGVNAIACEITEEGLPSYVPLRFELPMAINVNFNMQIPENVRINPAISLECFKVELDGEDLVCTGNYTGAVSLYADKREPCITAVNLTDEHYEDASRTVSVYYPLSGESLFDVAKRFHTTPLRIAKDNRLTESVFSSSAASLLSNDIRYLVIGVK
ncbi:MAG: hypothetical protein IKC87_02895 [Clostridia bacterium]|nr:hypothetical protein [Clostridia bacterium]